MTDPVTFSLFYRDRSEIDSKNKLKQKDTHIAVSTAEIEGRKNQIENENKRIASIEAEIVRIPSETHNALINPALLEWRLQNLAQTPWNEGDSDRLLRAVKAAVGWWTERGRRPILIVNNMERKFLWRQLSVELPDTVVLCYQELGVDLSLEPVSRAGG